MIDVALAAAVAGETVALRRDAALPPGRIRHLRVVVAATRARLGRTGESDAAFAARLPGCAATAFPHGLTAAAADEIERQCAMIRARAVTPF